MRMSLPTYLNLLRTFLPFLSNLTLTLQKAKVDWSRTRLYMDVSLERSEIEPRKRKH